MNKVVVMSSLLEDNQPTELNAPRRQGLRHRQIRQGITGKDKMQASLLDRLTDDAPEKRLEPASSMMITHNILRRQVLRDLQWLFNCINNEAQHDLTPYPEVASSTLNFGVAPLAGKRLSDIEWDDMQQRLTRAIINFEPRILPTGLQVRCLSDTKALDLHNVLSIEIKGQLWCVPYPLEFLFRTDVDLENGHFELQDAG
jgi:type VI secretion system protein ImpF